MPTYPGSLNEFYEDMKRIKMSDNMDMPVQYDLTNQELINDAKDLHGQLYHRINSQQVIINRLREENIRLKKNQFSPDEIKKIRETFERALEYLK